jgi:hypothetical protein
MKFTRLHTAAVTGLAAVALTAAGSVALPTQSQAIEPVTTAIIGGLIAGVVVGGAAHHHRDRTVVYESRPSHSVRHCSYATERVFDPYEGDYDYRKVRIC